MARAIYGGSPTLPHSLQYTPDSDEEVIIQFQGSCYSATDNKKIGFTLSINGTDLTSTWIYSNGKLTHRATNMEYVVYKFPLNVNAQTHAIEPVTIEIRAMTADTVIDKNDQLSLVITGKNE